MDDFWNPSPDTVERCDEDRPLDERHLWPQDTGKLPYDARCALLQLINCLLYTSDAADEL